jgi:hypothetical protein
MVDALRDAKRVLRPGGVLIDVRPLIAPMAAEVVAGAGVVWTATVDSCGTREDIAAADAAVASALSRHWFACEKVLAFELEVYCDTAADLRAYAEERKLRDAAIPYSELDERRRASGPAARLRCRRPWGLQSYRKQ